MWVEHVEFQLSVSQAGHTADGHVHVVGAVMGADSEHQQQSCGGAVVVGVFVLYRLAACPRHGHVIQVACNTGNSGLSVPLLHHVHSSGDSGLSAHLQPVHSTGNSSLSEHLLHHIYSTGNSGLSVHPTSCLCPKVVAV